MGLPLRHPTSFNPIFTSGTSPGSSPGEPTIPESDSDLDPEPSGYCDRRCQLKTPHRLLRSSRRGLPINSGRTSPRAQQQHRKPGHQASHLGRHRPAPVRPAAAETHHVKPCNHWAADADEGRALARSNILLLGEHHHATQPLDQRHGHERHRRSSRSPSSSDITSDGRRRRPPSLERQDAFCDEKTVKRQRRRCSWDDETPSPGLRRAATTTSTGFPTRVGRTPSEDDDMDDMREIADLYRMGLLYDDEHERGEGFSLGQIVREEPVYSVRVRPARRRGRGETSSSSFVPSLTVDLAFSAFAEDEALARWLVSSCASSSSSSSSSFYQGMGSEGPVSWRVTVHDTPQLPVVYELANNAVSGLLADDFLGSGSVSDFSDCVAEEDFGQHWAMFDACTGKETGASATAETTMAVADDVGEEVDGPWVVLGHDGL